MTSSIIGFAIDSFRGGRKLLYAAKPGEISIQTKDGVRALRFSAGDIILAGPDNRAICGPIGVNGAVDLAERILDGDERAVTDPLSLLALATAVVGFFAPGESGEAPVQAAAVEMEAS